MTEEMLTNIFIINAIVMSLIALVIVRLYRLDGLKARWFRLAISAFVTTHVVFMAIVITAISMIS